MKEGSVDTLKRVFPPIWTAWRRHLPILLLLSVLTIIIFNGYADGTLPLGNDSIGLVMTEEMNGLESGYFSTWEPYAGMGFQNDPLLLPAMLFHLTHSLGLSVPDVCKVLMVISFWMSGLLMYICALRISKSRLGSGAAAIVFAMNQVFLSQIMEGHYFFALGFSLLPALFLVFYLAMTEDHKWATILLPIAFYLYGSAAAPNMVMIAAMFFLTFTILWALLSRPKTHRLLYPPVALTALLLPTVISRFVAGSGMSNTFFHIYEAEQWSNHSLLDALLARSTEDSHLINAGITTWVFSSGLVDVAVILSLLVPALALVSLLFIERRRLKIALVVTGLAFAFLAKGPNEPLSGLFVWIYYNVPFMDSLRVYSRLGMFIGLVYALLICFLIADLQKAAAAKGWNVKPWKGNVFPWPEKVIALGVAAIVLLSSSTILIQGPGAFDPPHVYTEPFQYLSEIDGDYRVLTLPLGVIYYDPDQPRYFGYPSTVTNDPGIYSQIYTGKDVAYGNSAEEYWTFWERVMAGHRYGYLNMTSIIGDSASVRYVVAQVHTDSGQIADFSSMSGLVQAINFTNGGTVWLYDLSAPRVHAASSLTVMVGTRTTMLSSVAVGAVTPTKDDLVLLEQVSDPATRGSLLDLASELIISDADLFELMIQTTTWDSGQLVALRDYGDPRSGNFSEKWATTMEPVYVGLTNTANIYTEGKNTVSVPVQVKEDGSYHLWMKMLSGPNTGGLTITIDGQPAREVRARSSMVQEVWVDVGTYDLNGSSTSVIITNDGQGWNSLNGLLLIEASEEEEKMAETAAWLKGGGMDLTYIFQINDIMADLPGGWHETTGPKGTGLSNNRTEFDKLVREVYIPRAGNWSMVVETLGPPYDDLYTGGPTIAIDGVTYNGTAIGDSRYSFELDLSEGQHKVTINTSSFYSMIMSERSGPNAEPTSATITYEKEANYRYVAHISTDGPTFIKFAESYNVRWVASAGQEALLHYPSYSQVNGYYLPEAGNYTVLISYSWQDSFEMNSILSIVAVAVATCGLSLYWRRFGKRGRNTE